MPKKGVFGMKAMPLDAAMGYATNPKPQKRDPEVTIKKIKTGFLVSCSPETTDKYEDVKHAAADMASAMEIAERHLSGEKPEKKEEKD